MEHVPLDETDIIFKFKVKNPEKEDEYEEIDVKLYKTWEHNIYWTTVGLIKLEPKADCQNVA